MNKILTNINYCLYEIKQDFFFFISLVISYAAALLIPICLLGMSITIYGYLLTYIPDPANQTITFYLSLEDNQQLLPDKIKAENAEIAYFSMHQNKDVIALVNNDYLVVSLAGVNEDIDDIFRLQKVKGYDILDKQLAKSTQKYCWIGSDMYHQMGDSKEIVIDDIAYQVAGVIHNREMADMILIDVKDYLNHSDKTLGYSFKLKSLNNREQSIQKILNNIESQYGLSYSLTGDDWSEYENHNQTLFSSLIFGSVIVSIGVLLYAFLNILSIMKNKIESKESLLQTQIYLGISAKQLYFQEWFYLIVALFVATIVDFAFLSLIKQFLASSLHIYIELNAVIFIVVIAFAVLICLLMSSIILRRHIKKMMK